MNSAQISMQFICAIFQCARRIIGEDAVKLANDVPGLKITPQGEIEVTGDGMKVYESLKKIYEQRIYGSLILDNDITVNVHRPVSPENSRELLPR